jgi:hypothetical protein
MSRTHRLTEERETPTMRAISFIERPCSWRSLRASILSTVFTVDNYRRLRTEKRAAGIEPALTGWKPVALPLSYARVFWP